ARWLGNFSLDDDTLGSLEVAVLEADDYEEAAREWLEDHRHLVEPGFAEYQRETPRARPIGAGPLYFPASHPCNLAQHALLGDQFHLHQPAVFNCCPAQDEREVCEVGEPVGEVGIHARFTADSMTKRTSSAPTPSMLSRPINSNR